jgi:hypothetical protein
VLLIEFIIAIATPPLAAQRLVAEHQQELRPSGKNLLGRHLEAKGSGKAHDDAEACTDV